MGLKNLAEAIILQSVEDLWDEKHRNECLAFFTGEGFVICSRLAGLESEDRSKLAGLIGELTVHSIAKERSGHFVGGR